MDGMKQAVREPAVSDVFQTICTLAACAAALIPVSGCIRAVCEAAESTSVFMASFVPGLCRGTADGRAGGRRRFLSNRRAVCGGAVFLACHQHYPAFDDHFPGARHDRNGDQRHETGRCGRVYQQNRRLAAEHIVHLVCRAFVPAELGGGGGRYAGGRAIKFSLSSFIPVVGGALSEAFNTVKGCLGLLKSTLGGFGILATVLIVLPPMLECAAWSLCLSLCVMAADMLELKTMSGLLTAVRSVTNTLIGLLASCSLFMIIATSIMTLAGRGG